MITDGKQTVDKGPYTPLDKASQPLKDKGVFVYALGIGKGVEPEQLQQIATNRQGVFVAPSFDGLKPMIRTILNSVCGEGKTDLLTSICLVNYAISSLVVDFLHSSIVFCQSIVNPSNGNAHTTNRKNEIDYCFSCKICQSTANT